MNNKNKVVSRNNPTKNPNTIAIVKMRTIGYTYDEIGSKFGITKQRAEQIYKAYIKKLGV